MLLHSLCISRESAFLYLVGKTPFLLHCKRTSPVAWKIHSVTILTPYSFFFAFLLPLSYQGNKTGPSTRKAEKQLQLQTQSQARTWSSREDFNQASLALRNHLRTAQTAAGRAAGSRQALGIFHLTCYGLVSFNISFKDPGRFKYRENSLQQPLKALQLARFGIPR